jgi:putative amide transporter protein
MLGLILLYVGAVLFINALAMLSHIAPKEAAIMNLFTGGLSLFVALHQIAEGDATLVRAAAFGLLFSFTYLWIAYIHLTGLDGRGLGWFSLFVAITASWVTVDALADAKTQGDHWMVGNWAAWTLLWFCFFVIGVLKKQTWVKPVAWLALGQSIVTAWVPGYLMLSGRLN